MAIETSGEIGSLALGRMDDERSPSCRRLSAARRHTRELFPLMRTMLGEAGLPLRSLPYFAYSEGPGSFTGLRLAATIARMLADTTECRIVAVPTLEVVARAALRDDAAAAAAAPGAVATVVDARPQQICGALYEISADTGLRLIEPPRVRNTREWLASLPRPCLASGPGLRRQRELFEDAGLQLIDETLWDPAADQVWSLARRRIDAGRFTSSEHIVPQYVRPPECELVYERRRAAARARRKE